MNRHGRFRISNATTMLLSLLAFSMLLQLAIGEHERHTQNINGNGRTYQSNFVEVEDRKRLINCKCYIEKRTNILCSGISHMEEICLSGKILDEDVTKAVRSLTIKNWKTSSNLTAKIKEHNFVLTRSLLKEKLRITSASQLLQLTIANTSINRLTLCSKSERRPRVTKEFSEVAEVINGNGLENEAIPCRDLGGLEILDLRSNKLTHLTEFRLPSLRQLYLTGNRWACFPGRRNNNDDDRRNASSNYVEKISASKTASAASTASTFTTTNDAFMADWLVKEYETALQDANKTLCARPNIYTHRWHNSNDYANVTLLHLLKFKMTMAERCPNRCRCSIINTNAPLFVKVSCQGTNMTELPTRLPPNTQVLNVSNNRIKSLVPLRTNDDYKHLRQLMASDNELENMADLIGSPFVKNRPTKINFQYNKITAFNLDLLRPILQNMDNMNPGSIGFLFAKNPWSCECESVKEIQQFIYEYKNFLRDAEFLACGDHEDPLLISLDYNDYCMEESGVNFSAIIIVVEVALIILVLSKLSYDVWIYKKTGELPWLARHICLGYSYSAVKNSLQQDDYQQQNARREWERSNAKTNNPGRKIEDLEVARSSGSHLLECFGKSNHNHSSNSEGNSEANQNNSLGGGSSGRTSQKGLFSLQDIVAFRPRRHTASTANSSKIMMGSKSPIISVCGNNIMKPNPGSKTNSEDLIERCSSPRSLVDSPSPNSSASTASRTKKLSCEEAEQFRKEVIEPSIDDEEPVLQIHHNCDPPDLVRDAGDNNIYKSSSAAIEIEMYSTSNGTLDKSFAL